MLSKTHESSKPNFLAEKDQYFREADKWRNLHSDLAKKVGIDVMSRIVNQVASLVPEWDVGLATEGPSRTYFAGIFRAINDAAYVHSDWSPYDSVTEDWILNQVTHQATFNLYLAPVKGGRTIVHDLQWTEDALKFRDPTSYGYSREVIEGKQKAYVEPTPGTLWFFNARNMHEVEKVDLEPMPELGLPYRPRLALSAYVGLLPSEKTGGKSKLMFWS